MNEDDRANFSEKDGINVTIELYKETMEEIRERRRIEWQTFAVVNVIYAAGLKLLLDDYKAKLTIFEAVIVTIAALLFTYIWFIRIYGNARRYDFSSNMRNRIQNCLRRDDVTRDLIPPSSVDVYGGWRCWINSWPLWSGHVCIAICLYCAAFLSVLWGYRTRYGTRCIQQLIGSTIAKLLGERWGYEPKCWQWLVIIGGVLLLVALFFLLDGKLAIHRTCFLFRTRLKFKGDLDKCEIRSLQEEFEKNKLELSREASIEKVGRKWLITDKAKKRRYLVKEKKSKVVLGHAFLKIYDYD